MVLSKVGNTLKDENKSHLLSESVRAEIEQWAAKYPPEQRQSAVLPALTIVQRAHDNWLSQDLLEAVADYLNMPRIAVYEVATFYTLYNLKPVGKHQLFVCTNISCMLNNCGDIVKHLRKRLDIDFGETTADGQFTLKEVECLGACINAPVMQVDDQYHENLTLQKVDELLDRLNK